MLQLEGPVLSVSPRKVQQEQKWCRCAAEVGGSGFERLGKDIVDEMLLVPFGHRHLAELSLALFWEASYCNAFPLWATAKWSSGWV